MVRAVVFDIDQTLWDFHAKRRQGLEACLRLLRDRDTEGVAAGWSINDLQHRFDVLEAQVRTAVLRSIRQQSLAEAAAEAAPADAALPDELHDLYFDHRHERTEPYPDVIPTLTSLRDAGYRLGIVSNGNSDLERIGLDGWWDDIVLGPEHGVIKPEPGIYALVAQRLGVDAADLVCVGDDQHKDVAGPQTAGWRGVWVRRDGQSPDPAITPDATIDTLGPLPALVDGWRR